MVSDLNIFTSKWCKIAAQKNVFGRTFLGSGCYTTRIRRLCNKDQEVIQQGSGGYTTMIRRLYNKDQEVMFSDAIIEPLQKTFAYKGCKIIAQNISLFCKFCLTSSIFWHRCYYPHRSRHALCPECRIFFYLRTF